MYMFGVKGQIILSMLCAFLMKTRKVWLFSMHLLPLLARLLAAPHAALVTVNTFSTGLTAAGAAMFLLSNLFVPYCLARAAYSELLHVEVLEDKQVYETFLAFQILFPSSPSFLSCR